MSDEVIATEISVPELGADVMAKAQGSATSVTAGMTAAVGAARTAGADLPASVTGDFADVLAALNAKAIKAVDAASEDLDKASTWALTCAFAHDTQTTNDDDGAKQVEAAAEGEPVLPVTPPAGAAPVVPAEMFPGHGG